MVKDLNMDSEYEPATNFGNLDTSSPMLVNQPPTSDTVVSFQSSNRKKLKVKDDLIKRFGEVAFHLFNQLVEKLDKHTTQYLAEELDRLGFSIANNLKFSKGMRSDPFNVEVFKIIKNDDDKIAYARIFFEG